MDDSPTFPKYSDMDFEKYGNEGRSDDEDIGYQSLGRNIRVRLRKYFEFCFDQKHSVLTIAELKS